MDLAIWLVRTLLDLQAAREHVYDAGDLAEAQDPLVGEIGNVGLAKNGRRWCSQRLKNSMSLTMTISS